MGPGKAAVAVQVRSSGGCCTFDMKQQPRDLQMQGFHTLLQNQNVVKVLHDCRPAAAAVFYQKSITICNVFDTQVIEHAVYRADIYYCKRHNIQLFASLLYALPGFVICLCRRACHQQAPSVSAMLFA